MRELFAMRLQDAQPEGRKRENCAGFAVGYREMTHVPTHVPRAKLHLKPSSGRMAKNSTSSLRQHHRPQLKDIKLRTPERNWKQASRGYPGPWLTGTRTVLVIAALMQYLSISKFSFNDWYKAEHTHSKSAENFHAICFFLHTLEGYIPRRYSWWKTFSMSKACRKRRIVPYDMWNLHGCLQGDSRLYVYLLCRTKERTSWFRV
jgi:hypothetical protein